MRSRAAPRIDSVFTSRAIFIEMKDAPAQPGASGAPVPLSVPASQSAGLSRLFRIEPIRPECVQAFIRERSIEWYASWFIGEAPELGFRGVFPGGTAAAVSRALRAIAKEEARSRIIIDPQRLRQLVADLRRRGKRIVFTNGVFDLLHPGHLRLLQNARALGDALIVAINSDDSARRIKGPARPVIPQFARAEVLTSLRQIDCCFIFTQADPMETLRIVRPDVLAKGADYPLKRIVGARFVAGYGGKVARLPLVEGWSTSSTIRSIREF